MKNLKNVFLFLLACTVCACNGESLVDNTDLSETEFTKILSVNFTHHSEKVSGEYVDLDLNQDGTRVFTNNQGIQITIEQAYLSLQSLAITDIGNEDCEEDFISAFVQVTVPLNHIEDILSDDATPVEIAKSFIPDKTYCKFVLKASAQAYGTGAEFADLSDFPDAEGYSVFISGTYGENATPFFVGVTEDLSIAGVFSAMEDNAIITHPIHFEAGQTDAAVTFGTIYETWLDDVDFSEGNDAIRETVTSNVVKSLHQHLADHTH